MIDGETLEILERIAKAIERVADHFAPQNQKHVRQPSTLTTATYDREERERKILRDTLNEKTTRFQSGIIAPLRTDL